MSELEIIENQINEASKKEMELEKKLEKVTDEEKKAELQMQLEKVDGLIKHLSEKRNELLKD